MKFTASKYFFFNLYMCIIMKKTFHFILIPDDDSGYNNGILWHAHDPVEQSIKHQNFALISFADTRTTTEYNLVNEGYCKYIVIMIIETTFYLIFVPHHTTIDGECPVQCCKVQSI